jgi:hypothetical protein
MWHRFGGDIPIKEEVIIEMTAKPFDEQPEMSSDEIIKGEIEYSQWQDRDDMWWASRTYDRQNTLTDQFKS